MPGCQVFVRNSFASQSSRRRLRARFIPPKSLSTRSACDALQKLVQRVRGCEDWPSGNRHDDGVLLLTLWKSKSAYQAFAPAARDSRPFAGGFCADEWRTGEPLSYSWWF